MQNKNSFEPIEIAVLAHVVNQACAEVGGCDEATKEIMAERVLARAAQGECDFDVLLSVAINSGRKAEAELSHGT